MKEESSKMNLLELLSYCLWAACGRPFARGSYTENVLGTAWPGLAINIALPGVAMAWTGLVVAWPGPVSVAWFHGPAHMDSIC